VSIVATPALGGHALHVLVFGGPSVLLVGWVGVKKIRRRLPPVTRADLPALGAAAASLAAAVVHALVCPEHFREAFLYGLFFLVVAVAQLSWSSAILLTRHRQTLLLAGATSNLGVIALWAYTRLVGVPIGPGRGATETVGVSDLLATACELAVVVLAVVAVRRMRPRQTPRRTGHPATPSPAL